MPGLRTSLSMHLKRSKRKDCQCMSDPVETHRQSDDDGQLRSSGDTLVIPGRTRYPSDAISSKLSINEPPVVQADYLMRLSGGGHGANGPRRQRRPSSLRRSLSENLLRLPWALHGEAQDPFLTPSASRSVTRNVSAQTSSGFSVFSRGAFDGVLQPPRNRDTASFVQCYNRLALEYGLEELGDLGESGSRGREDRVSHAKTDKPRHWFKGKLSRHQSSNNLNEATRVGLARKNSVGSLLSRPSKAYVKVQSLDDLCRIGGLSTFYLPLSHRNAELFVPTPLAAAAQYLAQNGDVAGIFRIPGSASSVNVLYDHYTFPITDTSSAEQSQVETTVGSSSLPSDLNLDVHDVASVFKRFLGELPGGILGSTALFKALNDIHQFARQDLPRSRLIALALLSVRSSRRLDLISAVFGLLAHLTHDAASNAPGSQGIVAERRSADGSENMTAHAFGVVFAPLLLGDFVDDHVLSPPPSSQPKRGIFSFARLKPSQSTATLTAMDAEKEKMKKCSVLVEMLVSSWADIARQMYIKESVLHKPLPVLDVAARHNAWKNIEKPASAPLASPPSAKVPYSPSIAGSVPTPTRHGGAAPPATIAPDLLEHPDIASQTASILSARSGSSTSSSSAMGEEVMPIVTVDSYRPARPTSRSASLGANSPSTPIQSRHGHQLAHSATTGNLHTGPRWPSQHSCSAVDLPWWERGGSHSSPDVVFSAELGGSTSDATRSLAMAAAVPENSITHTIIPDALQAGSLVPDMKVTSSDTPAIPIDRRPAPVDLQCRTPFSLTTESTAGSSSRKSSHNVSSSDGSSRQGSQRFKVSALYNEILKLQQQLYTKDEENRELRTQVAKLTQSSHRKTGPLTVKEKYETNQQATPRERFAPATKIIETDQAVFLGGDLAQA